MHKKMILAAALATVVALGGCGAQPEAQADTGPKQEQKDSGDNAAGSQSVEPAKEKSAPTITPEMQAYLDEKPWEKIKPMISVAAESAKLIKKLGYDGIVDRSAGDAMADKTVEYFADIKTLADLTEDQVPPELWEAHRYMTESMGAITMSSFNMGDAADAAADRDKDTFVSKLQESQTAAKDCVKYWDVFISKMKEATGMSEDELAQIGITKDTMKPVTGE